jgi:hypothetical protein
MFCYRILSMLSKFCAAINVHLFIYYFYYFIKITGVCDNGPCKHEYIIKNKSLTGLCSVLFSLNAIFPWFGGKLPIKRLVLGTVSQGNRGKGSLKSILQLFRHCQRSLNWIIQLHNLVSLSVIRNVDSKNNRDKRKLFYIRIAVLV